MVRDLVFHLGDCKTGTTSIQTVLARGQWRCEAASLVYPAVFNHIPLAKTLTEKPKAAPRQFAALAERLSDQNADLAVISAEHFEFVDPARLAEQLERHFGAWAGRIRLIAYVRPHAERFLSTFAERSKKGGYGGSMAGLLERLEKDGLLHYTPRFERWRATFGEAFTLRPFLRERLKDGDVVRDFFDFVFAGAEVGFAGPTDQNESLSVEDLTMLREIHRRLKARGTGLRDAQKAFGWNFAPILAARPPAGGTKLQLHRGLAQRIEATYAADARALDAAFFEGTPMTDRLARAAGSAAARPVSLDPSAYHDANTLRLFECWADFLAQVMEADPAHFQRAARPPEFRRPPARTGRVRKAIPETLEARLKGAWQALKGR